MSAETGTGAVVVVGSVNVDLSLSVERHPAPGETLVAGGGTRSPGGKGANQALAARRAGAAVQLVAAVGEDADARTALALLEEAGVDLSAVAVAPGPTGLAVVTVDAEGENAILVVPGANASVDAEAVREHAELLAGAAVVVLQGEIPRDGIEAAARAAGGRVVLNPAPVLALDPEVLRAADPLVVNEHEAQAVLAQLTGDAAEDAEREPRELALALARQGVASVALTLGGAGAVLVEADGEELRVAELAAAAVRVVDTTGAGDAFIGALAAGLAAGEDLVVAARAAMGFAGASVTADGAQTSYPRAEDLVPGTVEPRITIASRWTTDRP